MYVLHALFSDAGCWELWAEDSSRPPAAAPARAEPDRMLRHPFAADPAGLADLLAAAGGEIQAAARKADPRGSVPLLLPSLPDGPAPSERFARFVPPRTGTPQLRGWIVPTLVLDPGDGAALLAALDGERLVTYDASEAETDVPFAASVGYATATARFAETLVRRGEVLPALAHDPATGRYRACWQPVYSLTAAAHHKALTDAMPPVFRAQLLGARLVGRSAADVLDGALTALVEAYVAAALTGPHGLHGEPLVPPLQGRQFAPKSATRQWLDALTSITPAVLDPEQTDSRQAERLHRVIAKWRTRATATAGLVRTCFRLVEPAVPGEPWAVELSLQSTEDPALLATAQEVWTRAGAARLLRAAGADPRRDLLDGLDKAKRVFRGLRTALLETASPTRVLLDDEGAYDFLSRAAPALSGNGFSVLLPEWWAADRSELELTLSGSPRPAHPGAPGTTPAFGLEDLVDYEWRLSLGGQQLTETEFQALAQSKSGLVRLRGRWVEVDQERIAAGLRALGSRSTGTMRAGELLRAALFGLDDDALPLASVEAGGWLGDLLSGVAEQRCEPAEAPPGLHATLRPYQRRGVGWLAFMQGVGLGCVLADSMGLGKTIQVLTLLETQREAEPGRVRPTLLVCPMSLVANWQRESARFTPGLVVHVHHGSERLSGGEFRDAVAGAHLVITTYGLATRDRAELAAVGWHRVVIDEAQAVKNATTKQARAVRSLPAPHRIALTGTPVENRLADLWSIMEFANPGLLGSAEAFNRHFARPIERDGDERAAERLRRATGAFVLRREKTDPAIIGDLPEKVEMKVVCNLTKEQASLYQATVDAMLQEITGAQGMARRGLVLATLTRLKQICNHPAHFLKDGSRLPGRSGKLARVEELCDEVLAAGEKALLFTQYAEFGRMLHGHLAERFGREVAFLHGGVRKKDRDSMVLRFERDDGPPLFVLSLKAGGLGLNLTAANHVIHVDRWWNPAVESQATDRAFRIGQRRDVQVRKLMCAGTLEERIDQVIEGKRDLAERIVGTGEGWLTELSVAELRDIVRLSADAVAE